MSSTVQGPQYRFRAWLRLSIVICWMSLSFLPRFNGQLFALESQQSILPDLQESVIDAPNLQSGLEADFADDGTTTVRAFNRPWAWYAKMDNYGRTNLGTLLKTPTPIRQLNAVTYQWNDLLQEQVQLDGSNLKQTFVLQQSPDGVGLLHLNLFVDSSFTPSFSQGTIYFNDTQNKQVLSYAPIVIRDAANKTYVASLAIYYKRITILLNDASAQYPLQIEMQLSHLDQSSANANSGDWFGVSLAADGDTLVVGASGEDSNGLLHYNGKMSDSGAAYTYRRGSQGWQLDGALKLDTPGLGDAFGSAVAISGDTIVVGAPFREGVSAQGALSDMGAAYVFGRSDGSWSRVAELVPADARNNDLFGSAVAIDGDTIAIGAYQRELGTGAVHLFRKSGESWSLESVLNAPQPEAGAQFGWAIALQGNRLAVSANRMDVDANSALLEDAGMVYLFERSGSNWSFRSQLQPSDPETNAQFGHAVALDGDSLFVSAPFKDRSSDGAADLGAVYVFGRTAGSWNQQAILTASDSQANDRFGWSIALQDNSVLLSSPYALRYDSQSNALTRQGAAHLFAREGESWQELIQLGGPVANQGSMFGWSSTFFDDSLFVGAYSESNSNPQSGSVYLYSGEASLVLERSGTQIANNTLGHNFGILPSGQSASVTFTIRNDSAVELRISDLSLSGDDASSFSLDSSGLQSSIAPNASSSFTVHFVSPGEEDRRAFISFRSNDLANLSFRFEIRASEPEFDPSQDQRIYLPIVLH